MLNSDQILSSPKQTAPSTLAGPDITIDAFGTTPPNQRVQNNSRPLTASQMRGSPNPN